MSIRAPCCKLWFDCPECHIDKFGEEGHELEKSYEMIFACKKCKRTFRKQVDEFEEADEHCPHCDNHFMPEAKEPERKMVIEFKAEKGHENKMFIDEREKDRGMVLQKDIW